MLFKISPALAQIPLKVKNNIRASLNKNEYSHCNSHSYYHLQEKIQNGSFLKITLSTAIFKIGCTSDCGSKKISNT